MDASPTTPHGDNEEIVVARNAGSFRQINLAEDDSLWAAKRKSAQFKPPSMPVPHIRASSPSISPQISLNIQDAQRACSPTVPYNRQLYQRVDVDVSPGQMQYQPANQADDGDSFTIGQKREKKEKPRQESNLDKPMKPDYANMTREQYKESKKKLRERLIKLGGLMKNVSIEVSGNLSDQHDLHEDLIKSVRLKHSVMFWKKVLTYVFIAVEAGVGKLTGINVDGFAESQREGIDDYDYYIWKYAEERIASYQESESSLKFEIGKAMFFNMALFIFFKLVEKKVGKDASSSFRKMARKFLKNDAILGNPNYGIGPDGLSEIPEDPSTMDLLFDGVAKALSGGDSGVSGVIKGIQGLFGNKKGDDDDDDEKEEKKPEPKVESKPKRRLRYAKRGEQKAE